MDKVRADAPAVKPPRPPHLSSGPPDPPDPGGPVPPAVGPFAYASQMMAHAVRDPALKRCSLVKDVLHLLADAAARSGRCYRSIAAMAGELGSDRNAIRRALKRAAALGYLAMAMRPGRKVYDFVLPIDPDLRKRPATSGGATTRPASGGARPSPVIRKEPGTEPVGAGEPGATHQVLTDDHRADGPPPRSSSPALTLAEARTVDALAAALVDPGPETVDKAANLMGQEIDGHGRYVGGFRKLLWDGSKLPESDRGEILGRFVAALEAPRGRARGRRFFREIRPIVPAGGAGGRSGPRPLGSWLGSPPAAPPSPSARPGPLPSGAEDERLAAWRRRWVEMTPESRQLWLGRGLVPAELRAEFARAGTA